MKYLLLAFMALGLQAQDITSVMNAVAIAKSTTSSILTVTAAQGDGTSCVLTKASHPTILATWVCTNGANKTSETLASSGSAVNAITRESGDVGCIFLFNPTATAVTMGSIGPAPAGGMAWSCSTNITAGGQTAIQNGSATWP